MRKFIVPLLLPLLLGLAGCISSSSPSPPSTTTVVVPQSAAPAQ